MNPVHKGGCAEEPYRCRNCEELFEKPKEIGPGLGFCSPCCNHHFTDLKSEKERRPCSRECCERVDPDDAKWWGYEGEDVLRTEGS